MLGGGAVVAAVAAYELVPRRATFDLPIPPGQEVGPEYLAATLAKQPAPTMPMPTDGRGWTGCGAGGSSTSQPGLDLVLVIDTTGSMGSVLADLKVSLRSLVSNLSAAGGDVRIGAVAYKDSCDREVLRSLPLTPLDQQGINTLSAFIVGLQAFGGCDWPEKMDAALDTAASMAWRGNVPSSIVVIADAPAHTQDEQTALSIAQAFHTKLPGARVSLVDTGSGGHPFMRALPRSGGGEYVTYNGRILNSMFPAIMGCKSA
jgi:hypothetical protein